MDHGGLSPLNYDPNRLKPILPTLSCSMSGMRSWQHEEQPIQREIRAASEARRVDLEPVGGDAERISLALRDDISEGCLH